FGWIYVQVESTFYRRFRTFYDDLERGAPLVRLRDGAERVAAESTRILRGAVSIQATVMIMVLLAAPSIVRAAGLPPSAAWPFRLAVTGAGLQVMALLEILFLYYFDLRREALAVSLILLGGEAVFVAAAHGVGWPPSLGYPVACASAAAVGLWVVRSRLRTLLVDTFQSQPFGRAA
ncbi:MAG TPA: exopolysaccharide Pel transporter PelG, partial [Polyangia bacterium]